MQKLNIDKLIVEAQVRGEKFFEHEEVKGYLLPYRNGGKIDPLLLWFLRRIKETGRRPDMAFIFQDWWLQEIGKSCLQLMNVWPISTRYIATIW
jgi:hypothetical protein